MKLKYIPFLVVLAFISMPSIGQQGYYRTKDSVCYGIKLIDGGKGTNSKICQVLKYNKTITYKPFEVSEYGINKHKIYIAKIIPHADSSQKVFLERLVSGKINLYYYKDKKNSTYFIEKDSTLFTELPYKDSENHTVIFRNVLSQATTDCDKVQENLKLVNYKRNTLKKFTQNYNSCESKVFPFTKFGFIAGYNAAKLIQVSFKEFEELKVLDFQYDGSFTAGIFIDKPILSSNFSLHSEINFSSLKHDYNFSNSETKVDLIINSASLAIPVMLRYTYPAMKVSPFLNVGVIYAKNVKNSGSLYASDKMGDIIYIEKSMKSSFLSPDEMGLSLGCGLKLRMNHRNSLFFEFRSNRKYNLSSGKIFNKQELQLLTGINF